MTIKDNADQQPSAPCPTCGKITPVDHIHTCSPQVKDGAPEAADQIEKEFFDWWHEVENFSMRCERFESNTDAALAAFKEAARQARPHVPEWISVDERLPETYITDDSPCNVGGRVIGPGVGSRMVLVVTNEGGVRVDRLIGIEGRKPFWDTYGKRVTHWARSPAAPSVGVQSKGEEG